MKPRSAAAKRVVDIGVALMGLILLAPMMIIIAVLIKLDSRGSVIYSCQRMGRGGKSFTMYKFRSMYVNSPVLRNSDGSMRVKKRDPRVTRVGRILRLGFDELPQLFNVLKGDMSLVGPRPDPLEALVYYCAEDRRRLSVRPGVTGLAQITGRTDIPWQERQKFDVEYVERQSLRLDIEIALYTILEFIPPLRKRRLQRILGVSDQTTEKVEESRATFGQLEEVR